jgi:hypothetical protein
VTANDTKNNSYYNSPRVEEKTYLAMSHNKLTEEMNEFVHGELNMEKIKIESIKISK